MKMPGWIVVSPKSEWRRSADGTSIEFSIRLARFWWARPSFWAYWLRSRRAA